MKYLFLMYTDESHRMTEEQAARAREIALPEPCADPADSRPLGEQVHRALGRDAERSQNQIGG